MSFTASRAHSMALNKAMEISKDTHNKSCTSCKGAGTQQLQSVQIPCVSCGGSGDSVDSLYLKNIWCSCARKHEHFFVRAPDGEQVFENKDTYLCGFCGFVRQFG